MVPDDCENEDILLIDCRLVFDLLIGIFFDILSVFFKMIDLFEMARVF